MPLCEGCGASYEDTFKFCPHCGRVKPEPKKVTIEVEVKGKAHDFDCPLCGDASAIQKVSAIVDGSTNISHGSSTSSGTSRLYSEQSGEKVGSAYSSSTTSSYHKSQSKLAEKLTPPAVPVKPNSLDYEVSSNVFVVLLVILYVVGVQVTWSIVDIFRLGNLEEIIVFFVTSPLFAIFGAIQIMRLLNHLKGAEKNYNAALAKYEQDTRSYQRLMTAWEELFYCHKHDVVYTLSRRETAPVSEALSSCIMWGAPGESE